MATFARYVAIGDSSTEGLEDPHPDGGYRGWADRLAQFITDAQPGDLEYANLAIRGLVLREIRETQFDLALEMQPDLLSIFGGVNDVIGRRCDFALIQEDLEHMFSRARESGATVITMTMPDPAAINPLGKQLRDRMYQLNDIVRYVAERYSVLVLDLQSFPVAEDPRLWFEDRLHGNPDGHQRVALGMAWMLGIDGFDENWAELLAEELIKPRPRERLVEDFDWAVHYLAPWLGKGIRGIPHGLGITAKRPVPLRLARTSSADEGADQQVGT